VTVEDTGFNDERFRSSRDIDERIGKWSKASKGNVVQELGAGTVPGSKCQPSSNRQGEKADDSRRQKVDKWLPLREFRRELRYWERRLRFALRSV